MSTFSTVLPAAALVAAFSLQLGAPSRASAQVSSVCPNWFTMGDGDRLGYCRNRSVRSTNGFVRQAVVFLHGIDRNAPSYYNRLRDDMLAEGVGSSTALIVPQFVTAADADEHGLSSNHATWTTNSWVQGNRSTNLHRNSSFEYVDAMIRAMLGSYYNLEQIVVVGFSAGGQYVNRYAAFSDIKQDTEDAGVGLRFVVAAPSSYLWLSSDRPVTPASSCSTTFNNYRYGLNNIDDWNYMRNLSLATVRRRAVTRDIWYLVGEDDNADINSLDTGCRANAQGPERLSRAQNYKAHQSDACSLVYGSALGQALCRFGLRLRPLQVIPGVAHSTELFDNALVRDLLFD